MKMLLTMFCPTPPGGTPEQRCRNPFCRYPLKYHHTLGKTSQEEYDLFLKKIQVYSVSKGKHWKKVDVEMLKILWAEGYTGSEIASRIGKTRNAVIGKAHRLGLQKRPSPIKYVPKKVQKTYNPSFFGIGMNRALFEGSKKR